MNKESELIIYIDLAPTSLDKIAESTGCELEKDFTRLIARYKRLCKRYEAMSIEELREAWRDEKNEVRKGIIEYYGKLKARKDENTK